MHPPAPAPRQQDVDVNLLLARIENPKSRRAAEDLLGDWERQGFVKQSQIDRLAVIRQLTPSELAEVIGFLRAINAQSDEEPDPEELLLCETLISESASEAAASPDRSKRGQKSKRLLTPTEVFELSNAIQLGIQAARLAATGEQLSTEQREVIARGEAARERMIICNQGLVHVIAQHFQVHPNFTIEDLHQEGIIGLITAVERFDPTRGYKFSTYASWWIRQAIMRALANHAATIRVPVHRVNDIFKYKRTVALLRQEAGGNEPSVSEIAAALQWTTEKLLMIDELSRMVYVSTNDYIGDDEGTEFGETLRAPETSPLAKFDAKERKDFVVTALDCLTRRERDVIERRFGLKTLGVYETLEDVGKDYHITRERIRQIQNEAIEKMRPVAKRWISKGISDTWFDFDDPISL
jgi:RNA polymerase primary sigma factor